MPGCRHPVREKGRKRARCCSAPSRQGAEDVARLAPLRGEAGVADSATERAPSLAVISVANRLSYLMATQVPTS